MGSRRGHGEGSIYEVPGRGWRGSIDLGWKDGRRMRKFINKKTRREVTNEISRLLRKKEAHEVITTERRTVAHMMEEWLDKRIKPPHRSPNTYRGYEQTSRMYIVPELGNIRIDALTVRDVENCLGKALESRLSPASVKNIKATLRSALTTAVRWRWLDRNVAKDAETPKQVEYEAKPLSAEEAKIFLEYLKGHRYEALYLLALAMGLRRGEAAAVRWTSIDLKERKIYVTHQLNRVKGQGVVLRELKSKKSKRVLDLPQVCVHALMKRKLIQEQERIAAGKNWKASDYVFTSRDGSPVMPEFVTTEHKLLLAKAGIDHRRFHDQRHSCATLLLALGVDMKMIQSILGHSSFQITANLYAHAVPTKMKEAMDTMDAAFTGRQPHTGEEAERLAASLTAMATSGGVQ